LRKMCLKSSAFVLRPKSKQDGREIDRNCCEI
jgi:hypothetical protein